jgi:hypothetical protein
MVTMKARNRDEPVRENHHWVIISHGPSIEAAAKAKRRGRDTALRSSGGLDEVDGAEAVSAINYTNEVRVCKTLVYMVF